MKKIFTLILISVMVSFFFNYKTLGFSLKTDIPATTQKSFDSHIETDIESVFLQDVSSNGTFPLPDDFQKRAIAIIIVGSIPVSIIFLIILYRSRRRRKEKTKNKV